MFLLRRCVPCLCRGRQHALRVRVNQHLGLGEFGLINQTVNAQTVGAKGEKSALMQQALQVEISKRPAAPPLLSLRG